jgi:hypothetical protein
MQYKANSLVGTAAQLIFEVVVKRKGPRRCGALGNFVAVSV